MPSRPDCLVEEIEDDVRALIAPIDQTTPGSYTFWRPIRYLIAAERDK